MDAIRARTWRWCRGARARHRARGRGQLARAATRLARESARHFSTAATRHSNLAAARRLPDGLTRERRPVRRRAASARARVVEEHHRRHARSAARVRIRRRRRADGAASAMVSEGKRGSCTASDIAREVAPRRVARAGVSLEPTRAASSRTSLRGSTGDARKPSMTARARPRPQADVLVVEPREFENAADGAVTCARPSRGEQGARTVPSTVGGAFGRRTRLRRRHEKRRLTSRTASEPITEPMTRRGADRGHRRGGHGRDGRARGARSCASASDVTRLASSRTACSRRARHPDRAATGAGRQAARATRTARPTLVFRPDAARDRWHVRRDSCGRRRIFVNIRAARRAQLGCIHSYACRDGSARR